MIIRKRTSKVLVYLKERTSAVIIRCMLSRFVKVFWKRSVKQVALNPPRKKWSLKTQRDSQMFEEFKPKIPSTADVAFVTGTWQD